MSDSMITRCPKCSTTFRVTQEVLSMAKGKVRCGQCFHIFTAEPAAPEQKATPTPTPSAPVAPKNAPEPTYRYAEPEQQQQQQPKQNTATTPVKEDGDVNPDWLDTLFHEEDLAPYTPPEKTQEHDSTYTDAVIPKASTEQTASKTSHSRPSSQQADDLAPWEVELAELEDQFSAQSQDSDPVFSEALAARTKTPNPRVRPTAQPMRDTVPLTPAKEAEEPDYMQALHTLAQDISKHDGLNEADYSSQESMKQLAAEYSLASLTDSDTPKPKKKRAKYTWLWLTGSIAAALLLTLQIAMGFFEQGSRSPEFRSFYKTACAYLGCTLPSFEDISAIEIEHVRIQSHPTLPNTLQVNAIMTNTSRYAQPMPKLALEFYDLNRAPVAARLFAPQNYLHRDFLDITYMPASTPIHVVIPIQDPGARAVTHQIKVFSNQTQSY